MRIFLSKIKNHKVTKILWYAIFVVYLAVLLRITVFRSDIGTHELFSGEIVLVPFTELFKTLHTSLFTFVYLFFGNLLWFVPLGFFVCAESRKNGLIKALLFGFLLSLFIEAMQYVFSTGVSETEDLILNTCGAFLGGLAACSVSWLKKRKVNKTLS